MAYRRAVSATAASTGWAAGPPARALASSPASASSWAAFAAGGPVVAEVVDDLVGVAGEAVQRVHGGPPRAREQPGGEEVGAAVAGVERAAGRVGGPQRRVGDPGGVELSPPARHRWRAARRPPAGAARSAAASPVGSSAGARGLRRAPAASRSGSGLHQRPRGEQGHRHAPREVGPVVEGVLAVGVVDDDQHRRRDDQARQPAHRHGTIGQQRHAPAHVPGQRGGREHGHGQQHDAGAVDRPPARRRAPPTTGGTRSRAAGRRR